MDFIISLLPLILIIIWLAMIGSWLETISEGNVSIRINYRSTLYFPVLGFCLFYDQAAAFHLFWGVPKGRFSIFQSFTFETIASALFRVDNVNRLLQDRKLILAQGWNQLTKLALNLLLLLQVPWGACKFIYAILTFNNSKIKMQLDKSENMNILKVCFAQSSVK